MSTSNMGSVANYARWIAVLRIVLGGLFLYAGIPKLVKLFADSAYMAENLKWMHDKAWPPGYAHFLTIITHNDTLVVLFGVLVAVGETAVGIGLILGLFTRLSAFFGAVMNANYLFAVYKASPGFLSSNNFWFTVLHIFFIGTAAGRAWGLDALVVPKLPKWLRWLG